MQPLYRSNKPLVKRITLLVLHMVPATAPEWFEYLSEGTCLWPILEPRWAPKQRLPNLGHFWGKFWPSWPLILQTKSIFLCPKWLLEVPRIQYYKFYVQMAPLEGILGPLKSVLALFRHKAKTHLLQKFVYELPNTSQVWAKKLANGDFRVQKYG